MTVIRLDRNMRNVIENYVSRYSSLSAFFAESRHILTVFFLLNGVQFPAKLADQCVFILRHTLQQHA